MTEAFNRFMKQATSQGREYGDGFNTSHFEGLTQAELEKAFMILEERAIDGDTIAINAVRYIDKGVAIGILEKVLGSSDILNVKAKNQVNLEAFHLTRKSRFLSNMIDNLKSCSEHEKWHCIQSLCSIEYGQIWHKDARSVFDRLVLDEEDEVLRHSLAKKILLEEGVIEGTSDYMEKIAQLVSSERDVRQKALMGI